MNDNSGPTDTSFPSPSMGGSPLPQQEADISPQTSTTTSDPSSTVSFASSDSTVTTSAGSGGRRRRVIMIAILMFAMLGGLASGTYLLTNRQTEPSFGWDCALYQFNVDTSGTVTVQNASARDLPAQVAEVMIDGQVVGTFDVPALDAGTSENLGTVTVPENGQFTWSVKGSKDCETTGSYAPDYMAECLNVKAFDEDWNPLTPQALSSFSEGDIVYFTIRGTTNRGNFEMARFIINGETMDPVVDLRPNTTDEFYYEYSIPEDITDFTIDAQLMHSELGWI